MQMNLQSLRPASDFARQYGVKAMIYGPTGSGKTPLINSAPKPVMLACEPGMLSMRGSNVPTFQAPTVALIDEFFEWFKGSNETKNFDTVAIDSVSFMCDIYLREARKNNKHGMKAYGEMGENVMKHMMTIYFMPNKHAYMISKETTVDNQKRPYYPGNMVPTELPGLFDQVLRLGLYNIPNVGQQKAFRCWSSIDELARDRTGNLAEFEYPDFGAMVRKATI